jgi:hypothetical protein
MEDMPNVVRVKDSLYPILVLRSLSIGQIKILISFIVDAEVGTDEKYMDT